MDFNSFNSKRYFYHYTKFCSALKILNSMTLLFHKLKDMNDINELYRPLYFEDFSDKSRAKRELECFQQISLTQDGRLRGFDIPAMWGHYAEDGNGVCLILDKEKVISSLTSETDYKGAIDYIDDYSSDIHIRKVKEDKAPFDNEEIMEYFFRKSYDWSYEQEFRILKRSENHELLKLDISNSFVGVVMHRDKNQENKDDSALNSDNYKILSAIVGEDKFFLYGFGLGQRGLIDRKGWELWNTENKPYGELCVKIT